MKFTIKNLPKSQIEINFELPEKELEKFKKEAILELGASLKVEGFRPGHIPKEIIEREVGSEKILNEAAEHAIKENYQKAVSENNIVPISQPQVAILKLAPGNPFEFKVQVFVLPEIPLPDYRKIAAGVKRRKVLVEEKEVEDSLAWLQKSRAKFSLKNEPAKKGDFVEIEYSSPQIEAGKKNQDVFILGEGHFIEGFENNLEGAKDGEEKEFSVQFPKDYAAKNLAGKNIDFKVRVKAVQKIELPEINDEFVKNLGKFENLLSLEQSIKEGLNQEKERGESARVRNEILEKICQETDCEIPEILIDSEKARIMEDLKKRVSLELQITFEDYLLKINKSEKELSDSFSEQAKKRVKTGLIMREISKKENIKAAPEETEKEMDNFLKQYPEVKTEKSQFDLERLREYTEEVIRNEKTFQLLESLTEKS